MNAVGVETVSPYALSNAVDRDSDTFTCICSSKRSSKSLWPQAPATLIHSPKLCVTEIGGMKLCDAMWAEAGGMKHAKHD